MSKLRVKLVLMQVVTNLVEVVESQSGLDKDEFNKWVESVKLSNWSGGLIDYVHQLDSRFIELNKVISEFIKELGETGKTFKSLLFRLSRSCFSINSAIKYLGDPYKEIEEAKKRSYTVTDSVLKNLVWIMALINDYLTDLAESSKEKKE